jgi:hypothetical protein
MRIHYAHGPIAGQDFEFELHETEGEASVRLFIGDRLVLEATCPDPPCHERVLVPLDAGGDTLLIRAEDMREATEHLFAIKAEDEESESQTISAEV